jgi:protein-tyrosine phosphatase
MDHISFGKNKLFINNRPDYRHSYKLKYYMTDFETDKTDKNDKIVLNYLRALIKENIDTIVVLLTKEEIDLYYNFDLIELYKDYGFNVIHFPIEDFSVPSKNPKEVFQQIKNKLRNKNILVHCSAGLGRTGLFVATFIKWLGYGAKKAIRLVRNRRRGTIETKQQINYVNTYKENTKRSFF